MHFFSKIDVKLTINAHSGSSLSLCKSSAISHFQDCLELLRYNNISKQGSDISLLSSFDSKSRVDFNMADSTSNDHRPPSGYEENFVEALDEDFHELIISSFNDCCSTHLI